LLHADAKTRKLLHTQLYALPTLLSAFDLLVVNDAATLPAALSVPNSDLEVRLIGHGDHAHSFRAVVFGAGDYHTDTNARPAPRELHVGERIDFSAGLSALVTSIDTTAPRLVTLRFEDASEDEFWPALYQHGRPIQYRHVAEPLELWDVQNPFASRPFAFEAPSAGLSLDFALLGALERRGIAVATLTHAAGVSALGSAELDARLPLPERYTIPEATRAAVESARARGGRVIAVGTTVVRALEASHAEHGRVESGDAVAELKLGPGTALHVVDALLTGMHEAGTSHFELLQAFAPFDLVSTLEHEATRHGYLSHEFGDTCLIDSGRSAARTLEPSRAA
jgi:S-adenosylmethionine:tRNA ribosyltransferase-isomerase